MCVCKLLIAFLFIQLDEWVDSISGYACVLWVYKQHLHVCVHAEWQARLRVSCHAVCITLCVTGHTLSDKPCCEWKSMLCKSMIIGMWVVHCNVLGYRICAVIILNVNDCVCPCNLFTSMNILLWINGIYVGIWGTKVKSRWLIVTDGKFDLLQTPTCLHILLYQSWSSSIRRTSITPVSMFYDHLMYSDLTYKCTM